MQPVVYVVDDEPTQRRIVKNILERHCNAIAVEIASGQELLDRLEKQVAPAPSVILLDIIMPGMDGIETLEKLTPYLPDIPVIVLTASDEVSTAVKAMKAGASDFITKPAMPERMRVSIENAQRLCKLSHEVERLSRSKSGHTTFADLIGTSPAFKATCELGHKAAQSHVPVLITGESGVGKEVFARAIHGESKRAGKPFIAINCGAIPENLVESILFGHEKGSFTGAINSTLGKFREANGGTLFLDEIGELRLDLQVKLLRALQEHTVEPVGAGTSVAVDVRIISATNRNVHELVERGEFREDVFYRLNVFPIELPSLTERKQDIAALSEYFFNKYTLQEQKIIHAISARALEMLEESPWPGNVRQLENSMHRAIVMCDDNTLDTKHFSGIIAGTSDKVTLSPTAHVSLALPLLDETQEHFRPMEALEYEIIERAIAFYGGRMSEVARRLEIGRSTLYRKHPNATTVKQA